MQPDTQHHEIVPRERLDFGLQDADIPKYWFGGDPFKTRFFDAMSIIFPPGERYFMTCVRDFRNKVTDPQLLEDIKAFNRQEAQHSMVHNQFNDRLRAQGMPVDRLIRWLDKIFDYMRTHRSREHTLGHTSGLEHFTALGAFMLFGTPGTFDDADPRVRAMYAWHAVEEVEHKGVAYDVMQKYAGVGYFRRIASFLETMVLFPLTIHYFTQELLKADGFTWWQRRKISAQGLWWLLKPGGLLAPMLLPFMRYFKPGYHPWDEGEIPGYRVWTEALARTGDPVKAGDAILAHAGGRLMPDVNPA